MSTNTVPEIWYKTQRVLRTALAVLVSGASTFAAAVLTLQLVAPDILTELAKILPASWIAWLTATLATLVVVASVITRIMAIPGVNEWLTKVGLGSVPKRALTLEQNADGTYVLPDPKTTTRADYQDALEQIGEDKP